MKSVMDMRFQRLRRSIEEMPRPAYIFLRALLCLAACMLLLSLLLFTFTEHRRYALYLLEAPAGVLLLGVILLAVLLDRL